MTPCPTCSRPEQRRWIYHSVGCPKPKWGPSLLRSAWVAYQQYKEVIEGMHRL